jgi:hypothetical protein
MFGILLLNPTVILILLMTIKRWDKGEGLAYKSVRTESAYHAVKMHLVLSKFDNTKKNAAFH